MGIAVLSVTILHISIIIVIIACYNKDNNITTKEILALSIVNIINVLFTLMNMNEFQNFEGYIITSYFEQCVIENCFHYRYIL